MFGQLQELLDSAAGVRMTAVPVLLKVLLVRPAEADVVRAIGAVLKHDEGLDQTLAPVCP